MAKKRAYTVFKGQRIPIIGDIVREDKSPKQLRTLHLFHNEIGPVALNTPYAWAVWTPPKSISLLQIKVTNYVEDATGWVGTLKQEVQFYRGSNPLISNASDDELDFTGGVATQDSRHIYINVDGTQNQQWEFNFPFGAVVIDPSPVIIASTTKTALAVGQTSQTKIYWVYQYI